SGSASEADFESSASFRRFERSVFHRRLFTGGAILRLGTVEIAGFATIARGTRVWCVTDSTQLKENLSGYRIYLSICNRWRKLEPRWVVRVHRGSPMRRILLAATALVAFSTVAVAADMPVKAPAYAAPAPMFNWTGFYIGGNVGAAWENLTTTDVDGFAALATPGTRTKLHDTGFIGGGQLGYNFQSGNWLVGIEGDIGWLDLGKKRFITGTTSSTQVGIDSGLYADVTGRIGYITNNNAL